MSHDVFVSYSSKDKAIADAIVAAMEKNNIRCWYAPRDIKPGEDWGNAISVAIEKSKIFLIVFSGNANYSQRVLDELNFAIIEEKTVLPFRIEKLEPMGAMKLHLSSRHWLDAYEPSWEKHIDKLVKSIAVIVEPVDEPVIEEVVEQVVELVIEKQDIDVLEPITPINIPPKKIKFPKALIGVVVGIALITAGWFGYHTIFPPQEIAGVIATATPELKPTITKIKIEPTRTMVPPTHTPQPTSTSTPAPAWVTDFADPILAEIASRPPDIEDNFTSASSAWGMKGNIGNDWQKEIIDGEMLITGWSVDRQITFHDYVLEITARPVKGIMLADIFFDNGSAIGYKLRVGDTSANIYDAGSSIPILSKEYSISSPVHIRIIVKKSQMAFYINQEPMGYFENKKFSLYRGVYPTIELSADRNLENNEGDAVIAYSNFKVWNITSLEIP